MKASQACLTGICQAAGMALVETVWLGGWRTVNGSIADINQLLLVAHSSQLGQSWRTAH